MSDAGKMEGEIKLCWTPCLIIMEKWYNALSWNYSIYEQRIDIHFRLLNLSNLTCFRHFSQNWELPSLIIGPVSYIAESFNLISERLSGTADTQRRTRPTDLHDDFCGGNWADGTRNWVIHIIADREAKWCGNIKHKERMRNSHFDNEVIWCDNSHQEIN